MDIATIAGILLALAAVLGGQALEGGHISSILQPTAAIIVLGGTAGAVAVQFPLATLLKAIADLRQVFKPDDTNINDVVSTIVGLANQARRDGLIAIEHKVASIKDPFMKRGLELAVDGTDASVLRAAMELELGHHEGELENSAKVFEAAGGYAPTVGILGAVLGLIHVMENLSDPSKLGSGIAVAFVATVYGVGAANLYFLPMASKLKFRAHEKVVRMEVILEGVCAMALGENPRLIERKLAAFVHQAHGSKAGASATATTTAPEGAT